jgi:hypothetical protein
MDLIVKMKFGAHLYGTATESSDLDYKGVFLPAREEIQLGRIPKCRAFTTGDSLSKNQAADVDEEIYSLHYFIRLACEGQTVALDMLHAPEPAWIVSSDIWRQIVAQRQRFYTKSLHNFVAYARRQAAKYGIKGSRLNAAAQVLAVLKHHPPETRLRRLWDVLPRNEHCFETAPAPTGLRQYQVCGKAFQETVAVGHVRPILEKFFDDYGQRARLAARNQEIDWKAVSHALRAAIQIREILTLGTIRYPLADAPFLMAVKAGRLDYATEVAPALEKLMAEVEDLLERSTLPERADSAYWDRFICETLDAYRFTPPTRGPR